MSAWWYTALSWNAAKFSASWSKLRQGAEKVFFLNCKQAVNIVSELLSSAEFDGGLSCDNSTDNYLSATTEATKKFQVH